MLWRLGLRIGYAQAPGLGMMPERFGWWSPSSRTPDYWMLSDLLGMIGLVMLWWRSSSWGGIPT